LARKCFSYRYDSVFAGIVYCFSQKDTEEVARELQVSGVKAACYHGNLDAQQRSRVHRQWMKGSIQVGCVLLSSPRRHSFVFVQPQEIMSFCFLSEIFELFWLVAH